MREFRNVVRVVVSHEALAKIALLHHQLARRDDEMAALRRELEEVRAVLRELHASVEARRGAEAELLQHYKQISERVVTRQESPRGRLH